MRRYGSADQPGLIAKLTDRDLNGSVKVSSDLLGDDVDQFFAHPDASAQNDELEIEDGLQSDDGKGHETARLFQDRGRMRIVA